MDLGDLIGGIGGSVAAVAGVTGAVIALNRVAARLHDIHTAVMGEPARVVAGVELPAVPSLGARMARIETEMHPNGGSSMRDAVDRTEAALIAHVADPGAHAHIGG